MSTVSWIKYPNGEVGKEEKTEYFKLSSNLILTTLGITYLQRSKQANSRKLTTPFQSPPAFQGFAICWNREKGCSRGCSLPEDPRLPQQSCQSQGALGAYYWLTGE